MRSRIRTSYIATEGKKVVVKYLHEQEENKGTFQCVIEESCKALPVLALNEVSCLNNNLPIPSSFTIFSS